MDTGFKLSLAGHGALLAATLVGWPFGGPTEPPEPVVMDVALYMPGDLTAPPGPVTQAPEAPAARPVAPPPPAPAAEPETPAPPVDDAPESVATPPPPVDRVAPLPQSAPPEDVRTADTVQPEIAASPDPSPDAMPAQEQDATAPEAAAPQIVTEATETADTPIAPAPRARPDRPEPPRETAEAVPSDPAPAPDPTPALDPTAAPEPTPAPDQAPPPAEAVSDAVTAALAEALGGGGGTPGARDGNLGGSLTNADRDGLRLAVSRCWNVGALGTDAMQVVVTVGMDMSRDGAPSNLRLMSHTGGSAAAAEQAYDTARRAILRCAPFDLPQDRYAQWRQIEMTFNPADMGRR